MPKLEDKRVRCSLVIALLLVMAAQLVHVSRVTSATWDEPHHLFDGYTVWTQHDYRLNPEVPPALKLWAALPLLSERLSVPRDHGWSIPQEAFRDAREFVFGNGVSATLERGRVMCMMLTLALGVLIYCAAAWWFGYGAGLFALALFVFDPNFLAHGALVTTDTAAALGFLAAIYTFYRYCKRPSWLRMLLAGVAAGLLLATKFTGILIVPILVVLISCEFLLRRDARLLARRAVALLMLTLCAWTVLWAAYGFRYKAGAQGAGLNPSLDSYLTRMYDKADAPRLALLAKYRVLPEAYLWGLENTKQTEFEDTSYFMGKVYRHGNRLYFPAAMLIKSTLAFLLLMVIGVVLYGRRWWSVRQEGPLPTAHEYKARTKEVLIFLLVPAAIYFAVAMHSDFDIGVRHLLPVYALLYVAIAGAAAAMLAAHPRWRYALGLLLCWQCVASVRVAPAYMAYGNELWGGPSQVHRYLSDANVDWGQQLIGVKKYIDANGIKDCWFAYFPDGAIEPADYGIPCKRLPTTSTVWWLDLPEQVPPVIEGTVFISDGDLEGIEFGDGPLNPYEVFRTRKPDAVIEYGVDVYRGSFPVPLASALVTAHAAANALAKGDRDGAMCLAESAAALAPGSAPVELQLGDVLAAVGKRDDARDAYGRALASARTVRPDLQQGFAASAEAKLNGLATR